MSILDNELKRFDNMKEELQKKQKLIAESGSNAGRLKVPVYPGSLTRQLCRRKGGAIIFWPWNSLFLYFPIRLFDPTRMNTNGQNGSSAS